MRARVGPAGLTALLSTCSATALAIGLGEPTLESTIGQPLRARIPLLLQPGEAATPGCVTVAPPVAVETGEYALRGARAELVNGGREILLTTQNPVSAPVVGFSLRAECGGQSAYRDYTLLPDPSALATPTAPPATPATRRIATPPATPGTVWEMRPGESVAGIAAAIYPGAPKLQRKLASAIVQASPDAFPEGDPDRPEPGAVIVIPDLRTVGAGEVVRRPRPAPAATPSAPPAPASPVAAEPPPRAPAAPPPRPREPAPAPAMAPALAGAPGKAMASGNSGLPLSAYSGLLEKIADLEALLSEMRDLVTVLPDVSAAPVPAATPVRTTADNGPGAGFLAAAAAAALLALGAFLGFRKRRTPAAAAPAATRTEAARAPVAPEPLPAATGVDTALQEAQLSMARGYPERAFELLEQHIRANPEETRTWMLFFAILRSQHMSKEYAELASRFSATKPASGLWQEVQRMGRELDPDNHLYQDDLLDLLHDWTWEGNGRIKPSSAGEGGEART